MAFTNIDILGLTPGTQKAGDVYPAVDTTDVAQSLAGTTKKYVLANLYNYIVAALGLTAHVYCIAASVTGLNATYNNGPNNDGINATLTNASGSFGTFVLDGVVGVVGQRYLIKDQTNTLQNGIYALSRNGDNLALPWTLIRTIDFNGASNVLDGDVLLVSSGTVNSNSAWTLNCPTPVVIGTSALVFSQLIDQLSPFPVLHGGFSAVMNVTGTTNITLPTSGTLATVGQNFPWTVVTANSANMSPDSGYIANNNINPVAFLLPTTAPVGSIITVSGLGVQGWTIQQNASQTINFGNTATTTGTGGSLASTNRHDVVNLLCTVANTTFNVLYSIGSITVT